MLALGPSRDWKVPVLRTEAAKGEGIDELVDALDAHRLHIAEAGTLAERRARNLRAEVLGIAAARMRRELETKASADPEWSALLERVVSREIDPANRVILRVGDIANDSAEFFAVGTITQFHLRGRNTDIEVLRGEFQWCQQKAG